MHDNMDTKKNHIEVLEGVLYTLGITPEDIPDTSALEDRHIEELEQLLSSDLG